MNSPMPLTEQEQYELYGKLCDACNAYKQPLDPQEIERLLDRGVHAYNKAWEAEHDNMNCLEVLLLSADELSFKDFTYLFNRLCQTITDPIHHKEHLSSLLTNAIMYGYTEVVAWLIDEKKLDVNGRNHFNETPLFFAVYCRWKTAPEIIKVLLERGANPFLKNNQGKLPYDKAPAHLKEFLPKPPPTISQHDAWQKTMAAKPTHRWFHFFERFTKSDKPQVAEQGLQTQTSVKY